MSEILYADDDEAMRQMVADVLAAAGHRTRLADGGEAARAEIRRAPPDLIILDYRMPAPNGLELCRELKANPRLEHLPVLILTAQGGADHRIQGFDAGADDYLSKPFDARELLARVHALLRLTRQGRDRNPTTGLPGGEAIWREYERRRKHGQAFSVCYLDLDHFKPFGDRFGFALADAIIRETAQVLTDEADESDFVGHIGGDDFVLMCARERAREAVQSARRRFRERLAEHLSPEIVAAGSYESEDRDGSRRSFPLTQLAAAVVHVPTRHPATLDALGEMAADAKRKAKHSSSGIAEVELPAVDPTRGEAADG